MMLGGGAAALFGELLGPVFLPARLTSQATDYAPGGKIRRSPAASQACRAQVDRATERMVQTEGYTATDRAIYILAETVVGDVQTGTEIEILKGPFAGSVWRLASPIDRDPVGAYWLARGVEKQAARG